MKLYQQLVNAIKVTAQVEARRASYITFNFVTCRLLMSSYYYLGDC